MSRLPAEDLEALCTLRSSLWKELDGARLFITGGSGFFGRWLVESAFHARDRFGLDLEITLLSRSPERVMAKYPHWCGIEGLHWLEGDVRNFDFPARCFSHVIHAATDTSPNDQANSAALIDIIVGGTQRVLSFAAQQGVRRFLYVSSGAVYGRRAKIDAYSEDHLYAPDSMNPHASYGMSKHFAEHWGMVKARTCGIEYVVARCFAFVGPGLPMDGHFAIGNIIRDALYSPEIVLHGDGTPVRSYLYSADLAVWLYDLLLRGTPGRAFNVGSDTPITIGNLARLVRDLISPEKGITIKSANISKLATDIYLPDIHRAQQELALEVWTPLEISIKKTAEWVQKQTLAIPLSSDLRELNQAEFSEKLR